MSSGRSFITLVLVVLILAAVPARPPAGETTPRSYPRASANPMADFPRIVLWAWERPENLEFIDPRRVGVAFLARTLYLRGEAVVVRPRLQPLQVPTGTALMAVVRIESDRTRPPDLSPGQRAAAVAAVAELAHKPAVAAIQVDFDATTSERAFYRELLIALRRQLPHSMALSITALSSWCLYDNWLAGLPIDEAVPMLFRMGPDRQQIQRYLESGGDFRTALCRDSLGLSTDEPLLKLPTGRRIYVFHPRTWSPTAADNVFKEVRKWQ